MPEPERARLGSGAIHLNSEAVHFTPSRIEAWRGVNAVSLPYEQVASLVMTDPKGFARGRLVVRLHDGESRSMSFGSRRLPTMRRLYRDFWRRVQAARGEDPDTIG
jgi:hypothetical protein